MSVGASLFTSFFSYFKGVLKGDLLLSYGYRIGFCPVSLFFSLLKGLSLFCFGGFIDFF